MAEKQLDIPDQSGNHKESLDKGIEHSATPDNKKLSNDLLEAVMDDDEDRALELIQAGADVNITSTTGWTYINTIGPDGKESITRIESNIPSDYIVDKEGKTALFFAVGHKNEAVVRALIDAGADVNIVDRESKIPVLIYAFRSTSQSIADAIISTQPFTFGADVRVTDAKETSALSCALENKMDEAQKLIYAGADINMTDRNRRLIDRIIQAGADVKVTDARGKSALSYALETKMVDIAQKMIDAGADVNVTDADGKTALFYAHNCEAILSSVIKAANVNVRDHEGKTALFYAVQKKDNESVVRALIAASIDVNITDKEGKTALFYAVQQSVVEILVEEGKALVDIRDSLGRTPLFYAIARSTDSARYLLDKGNSLYAKDYYNKCVVSFAYETCLKTQQELNKKQRALDCYTMFNPIEFFSDLQIVRLHLGKVDFTLVHKFFKDNGVERPVELSAIVNTVFCTILSNTGTFHQFPMAFISGLSTLSNVLELAKHKRNKGPGGKNRIIESILVAIRKKFRNNEDMYKTIASSVLPELVKLGADPNFADSDGNTALHYATRLPFHGVSRETVVSICNQLIEYGALTNIRNHKNETPLLFSLSKEVWINLKEQQILPFRILIQEVWVFLLHNGSSVEDTTKQGDSVFHLILALIQQVLKWTPLTLLSSLLNDVIALMISFPHAYMTNGVIINKRDFHLNSPLHLWATLSFQFYEDVVYNYINESSIAVVLEPILKIFLEMGAKLNDRNANDETPLHVCKTWSAVKLLLDAGANPNVVDSLGRPPLLTAAKGRTFMRNTGRFYPDDTQGQEEFWKAALEKGLDYWTVDRNGESVLSILIESGSFALAKGMVEAARDEGYLESDKVAIPLLNAICKDKSTRRRDKAPLLKTILKSRKSPFFFKNKEDSPLHVCCRNIVEATKDIFVNEIKSTALWELAELLLWYGGDCRILDSNGQSCLDIAEECQTLKDLLLSPVNINEVPTLISHWNTVSSKYEYTLAKVARGREFKYVDPFWFHQDHLASGSFGNVFAGINEKDGREVAIKRIEKIRMQRPEDKREITNLTALADCEQVVRYLSFFEDENFSYVVLELMEGNLDDYLDGPYFDKTEGVELCKNVISGLKYLHNQKILHRDLKPSNILYKCHPKLCLKIADFGLSRRIDSACTTVYGTNAGTRCYIAPEVLNSTKDHSTSSDVFACGLVLHYMLSVKKHPFAPADLANKGALQINHETEANILNGKMEGWDDSLCPEAIHLLVNLLDKDESKRPTAEAALDHPLFWSKTKKLDLLIAVGNQPEFECPRAKRAPPLTAVETDLENSFGTIVKYVDWNDPGYVHMPAIYTEMTRRRRAYDTSSIVELVRFLRNALAHVSESTRPTPIRKQLLEDFVFLEYFPNLLMDVHKAVTTHGWDQTREEIKFAMKKRESQVL